MSSTLFFEKTPTRAPKEIASFKLPIKGIIARRYYDHDGSLSGPRMTIGSAEDLAFFEGLAAGCMTEDRAALLKIVEHLREHGCIDMDWNC